MSDIQADDSDARLAKKTNRKTKSQTVEQQHAKKCK